MAFVVSFESYFTRSNGSVSGESSPHGVAEKRRPETGDLRQNMKLDKKQRFEAMGWKETTVEEVLNLSEADAQYIERKLVLSRRLRHFVRSAA